MTISDFDLSNIQRIGLDMIRLYGFFVVELDIQRLAQDHRVDISLAHNNNRKCKRYMPDTDVGITRIKIKDNTFFSDLIIGCTDAGCQLYEYVYLTLTVSHAKGCNLENMSCSEYDNYITRTLDYIQTEYGIILIPESMSIDYMEINCNIFLQNKFPAYSRVFRLLMSLFHNHMGKLDTYDKITGSKNAEGESYTRGNQSTEVIFYNKTQQLKDTGIPLEENIPTILRIELKLKNKKKIKSVFGTCRWKDMDDKKIAEYYHGEIYTQLSKKFDAWSDTRNKELKKLILASRKKSTKSWHHILMQEIRNKTELNMMPYILDIEQICDAFRQLPDPHRNAGRAVKSLMNINVEDDIYKNHDIEKVHEILNCLAAYYNQCYNNFN